MFTPQDGKHIVQRWKPVPYAETLHPNDSVNQYVRMLIALQTPEVSCICQYNTRRGLIIFAVDEGSKCVLAHMGNPYRNLTSCSAQNALRDLNFWLEELKRRQEPHSE